MTIEHHDIIEYAIRELGSFSTLGMFGHLFDLHPGQETILHQIEQCCGDIIEIHLRQDFASAGIRSNDVNLTLTQSRLEQSLSVLFSTHSPFWERYYARYNQNAAGDLLNMPAADIQQVARSRYPFFYTVIDALQCSTTQHNHICSLIRLSMQFYLRASLLSIREPEEAQLAFTQALQILGPVNAPGYRQLLSTKIL